VPDKLAVPELEDVDDTLAVRLCVRLRVCVSDCEGDGEALGVPEADAVGVSLGVWVSDWLGDCEVVGVDDVLGDCVELGVSVSVTLEDAEALVVWLCEGDPVGVLVGEVLALGVLVMLADPEILAEAVRLAVSVTEPVWVSEGLALPLCVPL
jgi:hypothetical protein